MTGPRALVTALALVLTVAGPRAARGQAEPEKGRPARTEPRKGKAEPRKAAPADAKRGGRPEGKGRVLRIEELKVEGRIQKPQAMFLMPRASMVLQDREEAEPLLPKVVEALEREPF